MDSHSPNWRPMGEPASDAEAEALEAFRELLPDTGAVAWTNVTFRDRNGTSNEIDAILLCREGMFLLEFKGLHGRVDGDQFRWQHINPNGGRREFTNPLNLAETKAKRFKGLLEYKLKALNPRGYHVPYVGAEVVMHGRGSRIGLKGIAAAHAYGLDGYDVHGLPPISGLVDGSRGGRHPIDDAALARTEKLITAAGLAGRERTRTVGKYVVTEPDPIGEGPGWQDFVAESPDLGKRHFRLRTFTLPAHASEDDLARIARQARREYLLTIDLPHPGIVSAHDFVADPPAVVFPLAADGRPLAEWLADYGDLLTFDERLQLIRELTETLQFAHAHRVHHRALSPSAVHVHDGPNGRRLSIRDWQAGARDLDPGTGTAVDTALVGGTEVAPLAAQEDWVYLAPEAHKVAHPDAAAMDVYGLGALAYLILTGSAPAPSIAELEQRLAEGGLDIATQMDAAPADLVELIDLATRRVVAERLASVDDFADLLSIVNLEDPDQAPEPEVEAAVDPLDAGPGDLLDGGWRVVRPLGTGSTGRALLVTRDGEPAPVVLKVAVDEQWSERLAAEAGVLSELDNKLVVKVLDGPVTVHGRTALVMEFAGSPSLGRELRDKGRLTLEQLDALGNDLLQIGLYLAGRGVSHRDIKPDNLAFRPDPSDRRQRLTLFDFSLAREDVGRLTSGTRPYLDPYLGARFSRLTYDSAAERFAIGVTLFEMATGRVPTWGDGQSDPADVDDEVFVAADMFEGSRPQDTADFFERALARDARQRFGSLDEMAQSWQRLFREATTVDGDDPGEAARDAASAAADESTPLDDSGLTQKAVSAARRLGAESVGDVLRLDPVAINQTPGIGIHIRRELQRRRREWIERLRQDTWNDEAPESGRAIEELRGSLVPRANNKNRAAVDLATALVAIDRWQSLADVADAAGVDMADVPAALGQLTRYWARSERLREAAGEVAALLEASSGVATLDELAASLVARHGSRIEDADERLAAALPVLWALDRAQSELFDDADIVLNRADDDGAPVLVGLGREGGEDPEAVMVLVRELAALVDAATAAGTGLVSAPDATALVADYAEGLGIPPSRLVRLAASSGRASDASTRGELYRTGLGAAVTLPRVLHGGGAAQIAEKSLRDGVARRYPKAAPLPPRPELDALVAASVPGLKWNGTNYARASEPSLLHSSATTTKWNPAGSVELRDVRMRLQDSASSRSGEVLAVAPRSVDDAADWLASEYGAEVVDLSAALIGRARQDAAASGIKWDFLLDVDAAPPGVDRSRLDGFMAASFDRIWPDLLARPGTLVLTEAAILARYGLVDRLGPLVDLGQARPGARWILIPRRAAVPRPMLDDTPPPLGPDGWLDLPAELWEAPVPATMTSRGA